MDIFLWRRTSQLNRNTTVKKSIHLQYSRADTKLRTHTVPYRTLPETAASSSIPMERGSTDFEVGSAGISKYRQSVGGQPLPASTASAPHNNGATDEADESTLLHGEDS